MEIKIIKDKYEGTSGDEISHYKVHFLENPTLREFIDWVLSTNPREWGYIEIRNYPSRIKYDNGSIVRCTIPDEQLNKRIRLIRKDGGWSAMDYTVEFEDMTKDNML